MLDQVERWIDFPVTQEDEGPFFDVLYFRFENGEFGMMGTIHATLGGQLPAPTRRAASALEGTERRA